MKQQNVRPKFATLQYDVLKELGISVAEYFYLDMMYYLSRDGWCYKALESIADDMNMSKPGVVKMRDRLIERGLLNKDRRGRVRTSVMYNKVYLHDQQGTTKLAQRTTLYNSDVLLSSTKNNNKNNKEKKSDKNGGNGEPHTDDAAYASARRKSEEVRARLASKLGLKSHA